jgi:alkanesulfonate monooxygenase SsuD/methylene tetrahydromethanopterin reductase-like flavin-dependent oxidoreductase (luciferase family)
LGEQSGRGPEGIGGRPDESRDAVRFAIGIPVMQEYADARLLVDLALSAEEAGWDGCFLWDHLLYGEGDPAADAWTVISAIAASTRRIRLGVLITSLARRRPWKVARETATLDRLSGGRLIFGAGLGSRDDEFTRFGEDGDARVRGEKVDEGLEIIAGLWRGEPFGYEGRHYRVDSTVFVPVPVQTPRIPVWIGGRWPHRRPFERAARWDGVFPVTPAGTPHTEALSPDDLRRAVSFTLGVRGDRAGPFDVVMEGTTSEGGSRGAAVVAPYADVGLTWWIEKLGWFRGTVDEMRARVKAGPPR